MKPKGIIKAYEDAKSKDLLTYLGNPTKGLLRKCLIDFINSEYYTESHKKSILNYFPDNIKSIESVITESKDDDFKAVVSLLSGDTDSSSRNGTFPLIKILLDYDLQFSIDTIEKLKKNNEEKKLTSEEAVKEIFRIFKEKSIFNSISINGDVNNSLGILPMCEYYIQLSYVSHQELHNRDSLIKSEKENSFSKVSSHTKAYYDSDLSQGYISESILSNKKVIISGNPGVGKSTYARWLCYKWAKSNNYKEVKKTVIYIQLRDLNFKKKNFILNYINDNYFSNNNLKIKSLNLFPKLLLILDGFDEISINDRLKLSSGVETYNYILLSRPYGLIQHNFSYDFAVQIDGFNSNCIQNYISKLIEDEDQEKELNKLIEKNKILKEYANTPLMLSYIVLIYKVSSNVKEDLSSIQSVYELQEKVFNWILDYGEKKQTIDARYIEAMKNKANEFAYLMLINKKFSYIGNTSDDFRSVAEFLSAAGLGSHKRVHTNSLEWKFTFNTVTFQEFLSAQYLESKKLNYEAIIYLVTDSFFWNFCIMIIGMLSKNEVLAKNMEQKQQLLTDTLEYVYKMFAKEDSAKFYGYAYYMLLAECNKHLIKRSIKSDDLKLIIRFYSEVFFDAFWVKAMLDSIDKIVYKLPYHLQIKFTDYLSIEISKIPKQVTDEKFNFQNYFYLSDLIEIGIKHNETQITSCVINTLVYIKNDISKCSDSAESILTKRGNEETLNGKHSEEYFSLIDQENWGREILSSLSLPLRFVAQKELLKHKEELLDIYHSEHTAILTLQSIISKIVTEYNFPELIKKYIYLKEKYNYSKHNSGDFFDNALLLSEYLYIFLILNKNLDSQEERKIIEIIYFLSDYFLNDETFKGETTYFHDHFIDVIVETIVVIDNKRLYDLLFNIIIKSDGTIYTRLKDEKAFVDYTKSNFKKSLADMKLDQIEKLLFILEKTPNAEFSFFLFKDDLLQLLERLIIENNSLLKEKSNHTEVSNLKEIIRKVACIPKENHEKKIFIDYFFIDNDIIPDNTESKETILRTISNNFIFYEKQYWDLFISLFEENLWNHELVIPFINNSDLFLFKSNHSKIIDAFINTLQNDKIYSYDELNSAIDEILPLVSQILFHLKNYKEGNKHIALSTVEKVLTNSHVERFCKFTLEDISDINIILAIILFYYYNPIQDKFLKSLDLYENLNKEPGAISEILDILIKFTENQEYGIEMNEVEVFKPILGNKMYNELLVLIKQRLINKNKFDPTHFEILMK
ncbi:NACHT domain-containing protein [Flavivirga jejuensis]|uniref:NACHT domain-containing protein n=1 Tax=Flavivirga jejuensis TaxID=870487 RepID=A0ABT8WVB4_9FLAO|nr:NACHT domain-containing protein [Flavivirga jejuensis]MDO5976930.1 NACHT domain-containing protein [Flavivirga jejuensis]